MTKIKEKPQHCFQGTNNDKLKELSSSHNVTLHLDYTQSSLNNSIRNSFNPVEVCFKNKTVLSFPSSFLVSSELTVY